MKREVIISIIVSLFAIFLIGCASTAPGTIDQTGEELQAKVAEQEAEIAKLKTAIEEKDAELSKAEMSTSSVSSSVNTAATYGSDELLPPNAVPGECYARVFVPPTYQTVTETVLKKAASEKIEIIPAQYTTVEETVMVKEASSRLNEVPATYGTKTEEVLVQDAELTWRIALPNGSREASDALLEAARKGGIDLASAQPGDCFHEHYIEPVYETVTETVLIKEASERVETVPAQYGTVEESILVKEESFNLVEVPSTYKWVEEEVLVEPARTEWKKGRGLVEKVDNATGEIMCLVEVPAVYETVRKQVVDVEAHVEKVVIPAEYKTVTVTKLIEPAQEKRFDIPAEYAEVTKKKLVTEGKFVWHEIHNMELPTSTRTGNQICLTEVPAVYRTDTRTVVVDPAKTETVEIPAEYRTMQVTKLVESAQEKRIEIPAEYQEITRTEQVTDGHLEWRWVLCETNMTPKAITKLQKALAVAGFNPGAIDGVYGYQTAQALKSYQEDKGLATGGITKESLESLGINL